MTWALWSSYRGGSAWEAGGGGAWGKTHQIVDHDESAGLCVLDTLVVAIYFDPEPFALAGIHLRITGWAHPGFGL